MRYIRIKQIKVKPEILLNVHPKQIEGYPDNIPYLIEIIDNNNLEIDKIIFKNIYLHHIRNKKIDYLLELDRHICRFF